MQRKKTAALCKAPILKNPVKLAEIALCFNEKWVFGQFFTVFLDLFNNGVLQRAAVFCIAFQKRVVEIYFYLRDINYILSMTL